MDGGKQKMIPNINGIIEIDYRGQGSKFSDPGPSRSGSDLEIMTQSK